MISANGLMAGNPAPATNVGGPVTGDTVLTVVIGSPITKATTLIVDSSQTLMASMLNHWFWWVT